MFTTGNGSRSHSIWLYQLKVKFLYDDNQKKRRNSRLQKKTVKQKEVRNMIILHIMEKRFFSGALFLKARSNNLNQGLVILNQRIYLLSGRTQL